MTQDKLSETESSKLVDIDRLLEITDGDREIFIQLSQDYLIQAAEILESINDAIGIHSMEKVSLLAHRLAGSSSTCGMIAMVEPLKKLEHLPDKSDFSTAAFLLNEARNQLDKISLFMTHHLK